MADVTSLTPPSPGLNATLFPNNTVEPYSPKVQENVKKKNNNTTSQSAAKFELPHEKTNKMACASIEDSDQPGHPPSLIRVFAVRMKKHWSLSYPLSASEDSDQTGRMPRLI